MRRDGDDSYLDVQGCYDCLTLREEVIKGEASASKKDLTVACD